MKILLGTLLMAVISSCSSGNIQQYATEKPKLLMEDYFNGKIKAHGLLMNRSGDVTKRFVVFMDMSWSGNTGTLKEDFEWSNGEKTKRVWTVKKLGSGKYEGSADDVIGVADGTSSGNAFHWAYKLRVPNDGTTYKISFDDRMYLVDEKVLINEATMYWYGIRVGKILISFNKP